MSNLVQKIGNSEIKKDNGWFSLMVPCDGYKYNICVKTSRKIQDCIDHLNGLIDKNLIIN